LAARIQGFDLNRSGVKPSDSANSIDERRQALTAMIQLEINRIRNELEADVSAVVQPQQVPAERTYDFGPPTQTYGGGNVLQLQQQLNAINPR
jgi:hypothetical protein